MRPERAFPLALAVVTVAAFAGLVAADFIPYDDPDYVTANPHVRGGLDASGALWALTTFHAGNWHPLTWVSHMLDVQLFGLWAPGHHATSLALHIASSLLLFVWWRRMTGAAAPSALVATLFALHPLHVESVAWVAERKDVLSALFWMLTGLAWLRYTETGKRSAYALALGAFTLGLMAKPMLVTLPFALLLLDRWPLARLDLGARRLLVEKLPLFGLAALSCALTLYAQAQAGALHDTASLPLEGRVANAAVAWVGYAGGLLWPSGSSVFYPHPGTWPLWRVAGATTLLVGVSALVLAQRRRPYLLVGWLWYLGTLVPVIGLVQVGDQWMADRYSYIPSIGLFVALAFGAHAALARLGRERALWGVLALLGALCAVLTFSQVRYWRDGETLFVHALELEPTSHTAHAVLAVVRSSQGRDDEAIAHYREALRYRPDYALAHYNLGRLLVERNLPDLALPHLEASARLRPEHARTRFYLGLVMERLADPARAARHYAAGLELEPDDAQARLRLALALEQLGRLGEARTQLQRAAAVARERDEPELAREAEAHAQRLR